MDAENYTELSAETTWTLYIDGMPPTFVAGGIYTYPWFRFIANPQRNSPLKRKKALISKGRGIVAPLLSLALPLLMDMFSNK